MIKKLNRCRVCSSTNYTSLFIKDHYGVTKCNQCNLVFLNFAPSDKFLVNYYSENFFKDSGIKHGFSNYEKEVSNLRKSFTEHIKTLQKYQDDGSLLDIGCATGVFMELAARYWQVYGIEISPYASRIAQEKRLKVFNGKLQDSPYTKMKFNVVTLWDTIEHLTNPLETVQLLGKMIKPKGIIALTTGDVNSLAAKISGRHWHLYNIPQHLSYFDRKTITNLLSKGGFAVREICYPGVNFTLDYFLFRLISFYKLRLILPFYKELSQKNFLNVNLKINLSDIMLVVAQKDKKR